MFCSLLIVLLLLVIQFIHMTGIEGTCYVHYKWDSKEGQCMPCPQGYFGLNCTSKCVFPHYGLICKSTCNCTHDKCHNIQGCSHNPSVSLTTLEDSQPQDINDTTINRDNSHQTNVNDSKTGNTWVRSVMFGIIGLAAVSIFLTMIYLYTHKLEKRSTFLRNAQHNQI